MKKLTFTFFILLLSVAGFSQITYYWVGGLGPTSFTNNSNWNTNLDQTGDARSVAGAQLNDILIFDGTNVNGDTLATGTVTVSVTSNQIAQLKLQNNASLIMQRPTASGGTGTLTIGGDGTAAPDFVIGAGCDFTVNSPLADGNVAIALIAGVTGLVNGTMTLSNTGTHRITSQVTGGLVFGAGSVFNSACTPGSAAYPFGSSSQSVNMGTVFQAGSKLIVTGTKCPFANTSTFQAANMLPGSNFYLRTTFATGNGSWSNLKNFGNLFIENGATFTADGPFFKIDTLNIASGCSLITHTSGQTPVLGNLVVDGSLSAPVASTNVLVMGGNVPQSISGAGTIIVPSITVANYSDVSLSKSVSVGTTCNIVGKLNFGAASQLTGAATFTSRVGGTATDVTGATTAGSFQITGVVGALSGNTGLIISGPGLDANTNVVGFSSSSAIIYLSKAALTTTAGSTFSFSSQSATLETANPNGLDSLSGSVVVTGTKSFQTGTNYIINAATTKPIGISSGVTASMTAGNITLNAPVTTNIYTKLNGTLTMNSGKLTIRPLDTVRIQSGNAIAGAPFSSSKYVVCDISGNDAGVLRIDTITTAKLFPVGTAANYLPVTVTPTSSMEFAVSVFEGATEDGTPTGTPFGTSVKASIVDAVWNVQRVAGTGDCDVQLNWQDALEGASFASLSGTDLGISHYNGATWDAITGSGDNTTNISTATFNSFSPFIVGNTNATPLPLQLIKVSASVKPNGIDVKWSVLNNDADCNYIIEKSFNGNDFSSIGNVHGANLSGYSFFDAAPFTAKCYYRIKTVRLTGAVTNSNIVLVKTNGKREVVIYPNPAISILNFTGLNNNTEIRFMNPLGQVVLEQKAHANSFSIDVAGLKPGLYFIEMVNEDGTVISKSVIKK